MQVLESIKSFSVERYQIKSATEGEPRSLRFTFEFGDNEFFEDKKLVKVFEYVPSEDGPGSLISKPVPIKWKSKKKDLTEGLLGSAVDLYEAEQAMKLREDGKEIDMVERHGLWQYEKLREKLEKAEASNEQPSIMAWFGFRGAVAKRPEPAEPEVENGANGTVEGDFELDEEDQGLLEVEIFPAGEEVAIGLAEDLWPDVMDYFMQASEEAGPDFDGFDESDEEDGSDVDEAPELVAEEKVKEEVKNLRPAKRQRTG